MLTIPLQEAEVQLAALIDEVAAGEEVVITRDDGAKFKIVRVERVQIRPKFGSAQGLVKIAEDFDAPLPGFEDYAL
ncbi:MAG: type II toxin-antitoxin system Phd/YefM family antitoxin [Chloroflexi bacterium]|nr:type II toxin-antitoxin system Phd/YefM family antitoxin [Chloroflexota bacterium]